MSEYQYYEFRAVDEPLTPEQMKAVRAFSTRAEITTRNFTNTYNYGDFGGNPHKMMERYYDAHVYVSNFGSMNFLLRLPRNVISEETIAQYSVEDVLNWWVTDAYVILEWQWREDGGEWMDGEGWMDRLLPIRDELVRGDYRSLYIGWLSAVASGMMEDDEDEEYEDDDDIEPEDEEDSERNTRSKEPLVPAGLGNLTGAQSALAEFLGVGKDLITVAAKASPKISGEANSAAKVEAWVAQLPEKEVRTILARIIGGEASRVQTDLQSRYFRAQGEAVGKFPTKSNGGRRTAAELLTLAEQAEQERKQKEQREKDRKRHAYLTGLIPRLPELWMEVNSLAEEQKATPYDRACALLVDMQAAYALAERRPEFAAAFALFLNKFSRSSALTRRLKEAKLMS